MPTYAYACGNCSHKFDAFQSIKASPLRKCPQCGKATLKRLIGAGAGILFKGSGFYCTDYRSDSYKKATSGDSGTANKAADKKTTTETKPTPAVAKTESNPAAKKKSA